MIKLAWLGASAVALVVVSVAVAGGTKTTFTYRAAMTTGAEVPKPKAPATAGGVFTATVTDNASARSIRWKLTFKSLSGKAVAAHIHKGKPGVAGGVVLALCGPCKTGQTGTATISSSVADALEKGRAYVNLHTAKNTAGEVRGQVKLLKRSEVAATDPDPTPTPDPAPGGGGEYDPY